jgi:hypothetical protein
MYDDPIGALEAELVGAARRQAGLDGGRRWPALGTALTAAAAGVALIVAVGAVALLGHHGGGAGRAGAPTRTGTLVPVHTATAQSKPGTLHIQRFVTALLGTTDPSPALTSSVEQQLGLDKYDSNEFVTGTVRVPSGGRLELWEFGVKPAHGKDIDQLAVSVNGRVLSRAPAAQVRRRGLALVYAYPASGIRLAVIVPNEVRTVRLTETHALALVHHNVATFQLRDARRVSALGGFRVVWYGANGQVLGRIGPTRP